jgi:hypothetical protein
MLLIALVSMRMMTVRFVELALNFAQPVIERWRRQGDRPAARAARPGQVEP